MAAVLSDPSGWGDAAPDDVDEDHDAVWSRHDRRVRADTTVIEANVAYLVDSSLLAKGAARVARLARRTQAQGLATRTVVRDRTRSVY